MRIGLFWRVLPAHIFIVAFLAFPLWQRHEAAVNAMRAGDAAQARLSVAGQTPQHIEGTPVRVVMPRLAVDVPIVPGAYDPSRKTWPVALYTANYATDTAKVNNSKGMSLIYGHWTPEVFGPTKNLKPGDTAYVYTGNNHIFKYVYTGNDVVRPTDTQILRRLENKPGIVLMTCDGSWAQNRRLMFFSLVDAR